MNDYYSQIQYIAQIDKENNILGKIEKWEAHEKRILHRAFTVVLYYADSIVLQHRKHLVFDGYFDLTFSSHQIYKSETLQSDLEAIYDALKREWNIKENDLKTPPVFKGQIYYNAQDPGSKYGDHEIDVIYTALLKNEPRPNLNFAYGYSLMKKEDLLKPAQPIRSAFAPWVNVMIKENCF